MAAQREEAEEWGRRYRDIRPLHDAFAQRLAASLRDLLDAGGVTHVQVEARAKDVESFVEKILRKKSKYHDPLTEMTDLSGIRIVVLYIADLDRVGEIIASEFMIDEQNTLRRDDRLHPDQFGYLSDHYVLKITAARAAFGDWNAYQELKAEVQVRTVVQHAWAAIDHRLQYKNRRDVPTELQRKLFRVSALLEVADAEFDAVRAASEAAEALYDTRVAAGDLDIEPNVLSVEAYLRSRGWLDFWMNVALQIGYTRPTEDMPSHRDDEDGDVSALLQAMEWSHVNDVAALDVLLEEAREWGESVLRKVYEVAMDEGSTAYYTSPTHLITTLVLHGGRAPLARISEAYGDNYVEALRQTRRTQ